MADRIKILLVEDNPDDVALLRRGLTKIQSDQFDLHPADRLETAFRLLKEQKFDLILLDLSLPDSFGIETLSRALAEAPGLPVVIMTGLNDETMALNAVRVGAQDYLVKGQYAPELLGRSIRYAIERKRVQEEVRRLNVELECRVQERTADLASANAALAKANEELRELDRMKSAFMHVTSHELRTPVTIINGMLEILTRRLPANEPELARGLKAVRRAADRLEKLVTRVLEISQAGEYDLSLHKTPVRLQDLMRQIASDTALFIEARGLKLVIDIPESLPPIPADIDKLRDVLLNLLMNAIKFTPDGGMVTVSAVQRRGNGIEVRVRDTGIGIPEADRKHLFQGFFSGFDVLSHSSGEFEFGKRGLGLGLAIVKKFVEMHGGKVGVESPPGEGSTFYFTLPLSDGANYS